MAHIATSNVMVLERFMMGDNTKIRVTYNKETGLFMGGKLEYYADELIFGYEDAINKVNEIAHAIKLNMNELAMEDEYQELKVLSPQPEWHCFG